MEVHAHSHHSTGSGHRKKWTHYLWEFLMLFLAVFCGFLAENIREHIVEKYRAKEFALSLLTDLKADTSALNTAIKFGNLKIRAVDSFFIMAELPVDKWNDTLMYKYTGMAVRARLFERSSGTYEQMKASGSLRYFKHELSDLLNKYDVQAKKTESRESINLKLILDFFSPLQDQIMDRRPLVQIQDGIPVTHPLVFRKKDKETIALWINYSASVQGTQKRTLAEYNIMLAQANQIIEAIQKEYHLK